MDFNHSTKRFECIGFDKEDLQCLMGSAFKNMVWTGDGNPIAMLDNETHFPKGFNMYDKRRGWLSGEDTSVVFAELIK